MKKSILIPLAIMAALALNSCDNKVDPPTPTPEPQSTKLIKQLIVQSQEDQGPIVEDSRITYTYDAQNRLTESTLTENQQTSTSKLVYSTDSIIITSIFNGQTYISKFAINAQKLATKFHSEFGDGTYSYKDKYVAAYNNETHLTDYTWANGNLSSIVQNAAEDNTHISTQTITFTDSLNKTNLNQYTYFYDLSPYLWSGFVGEKSKNLIDQIANSGSDTIKLSYEFDADSNPVKITELNTTSNYKYIYSIIYY